MATSPNQRLSPTQSLDLGAVRAAYADGSLTPAALIDGIVARAASFADRNVWIHRLSREHDDGAGCAESSTRRRRANRFRCSAFRSR